MSDLSQLYVNQNNSVDLWVKDLTASSNVQCGSVGMPVRLQNYSEYGLSGATATPCPIVYGGVITYNSQNPELSNVQEYVFAGAYSHIEFSNGTITLTSATDNVVNFPSVSPTGLNFGTYNNGVFTIGLSGRYYISYSLGFTSSSLPASTPINCSLKTTGSNVGNHADCVISPAPTSGSSTASGCAIVRLSRGDTLNLNVVSTFASGAIGCISGNLTFYLLSAY